jgi:hypothetical protein
VKANNIHLPLRRGGENDASHIGSKNKINIGQQLVNRLLVNNFNVFNKFNVYLCINHKIQNLSICL